METVSWTEIEDWLKRLHAPSLPPLIIQTTESYQTLSRLYFMDSLAAHIQQTVKRVQQEAVLEYTALSEQLTHLLHSANVIPLPSAAAKKALADLSKIASDLELSDMRIESFEHAIAARTMAGFAKEQQLESIKEQTASIGSRIRGSQDRQEGLRRLLQDREAAAPIEEQKTREWLRNSQTINQKSAEYQQRLGGMRTEQLRHKVNERGLEFTQIKELDSVVTALVNTVQEKQNEYDGYAALPPDMPLAVLKLEEAKQSLDRLRRECEDAVTKAFGTGR